MAEYVTIPAAPGLFVKQRHSLAAQGDSGDVIAWRVPEGRGPLVAVCVSRTVNREGGQHVEIPIDDKVEVGRGA